MKRKIWVTVLSVVASGLLILALAWLLIWLCGYKRVVMINPIQIAEASNSLDKGDVPIATTLKTYTIQYWLELQSSTKNSWSYPDYLIGVPRTNILPNLISCESGGNTMALNPVDKDGTASYGLLQFKPGTLYANAIKYGLLLPSTSRLDIMKVLYNNQLQVDVASHMIMDNWNSASWWLQQFPQCYINLHVKYKWL